jgi:hypothetical protein
MVTPLVGLLFKWSSKDLAIFLMFIGIIFMIWFFMRIWLVGLAGLGIFILSLLLLIKPPKSK